ncbi:hypothetical protein HDV06_004925 [Boothiomyces sp. JEL0866]|nr:hypothetical protein HDV06_004925 [Boothiomyces sp. JEL0866]
MNQNKKYSNVYSELGKLRQMHWKAQPRDTLLKPELHVSQLKTPPSKINECLYPDWWGHDEHIPESVKRKQVPSVPAGVQTVHEPPFHPIRESFAKKLVDETTQTNSKIPVRKESPPTKQVLQSSQYINSGGGYQTIPIDFHALGNDDVENIENQEPFKESPIKNTAFVRKVKVQKQSELEKKRAAKEKAKNMLKESNKSINSVKSIESSQKLSDILETSTVSAQTSANMKTRDTVTGRSTPQTVNTTIGPSPHSPKKPPPPDGVYAIADAFLNGSLIQCLNLNIQDTDYDSISVNDINSLLQA